MSRWYEVTETIYKTHIVEVDDDEDGDHACQVVSDITTEEFDELAASQIGPEEIESAKRHNKGNVYSRAH